MSIAGLVVSLVFLLISMTVHEFAHGWVAYKLGDPTAKYSGRLTLNPLAHIDMFWTVILPVLMFVMTQGRFIFGAAKPVPINFWALKNPKRDIIWVGLSGPLANFIFAVAASLAWRILPRLSGLDIIFSNLILINLLLGVFNLLPVPPLDGSRVAMGLLPPELAERYARIEPYGFMIVILLLWLGLFQYIIWPVIGIIARFLILPY